MLVDMLSVSTFQPPSLAPTLSISFQLQPRGATDVPPREQRHIDAFVALAAEIFKTDNAHELFQRLQIDFFAGQLELVLPNDRVHAGIALMLEE